MPKINNGIAAIAACMLLCTAAAQAGVEFFEGWNIQTDQQGRITGMTIDNPRTPMGLEKQLVIDIASDQTVTGGHVFFGDGIERAMSVKEARTYWAICNGPHAMWDFYDVQGRLLTLTAKDRIPDEWAGRTVRFVSKTNAEVFGVLVLVSNANQIGIKIDGACCGPVIFAAAGMNKLQILR